MEIVIHCGAHKTATTFLQEFLKSKKTFLRKQGIGYIPLRASRDVLFPAIRKALRADGRADFGAAGARIRAKLLRASKANAARLSPLRRLIISDENIAGALGDFIANGQLYPDVARRIEAVQSLFPEASLRIFFCIRDHADFLCSSYCEVLRHRQIGDFKDLAALRPAEPQRWRDLLSSMLAVPNAVEVSYWRFEDFLKSPADAVEAITTCRMTGIEAQMQNKVRQSLTRKGVAILQAARPFLTAGEHKMLGNFLAEHFEFEDDGGKFRIEDAELAAKLRNAYAADVADLEIASAPSIGIVRTLLK